MNFALNEILTMIDKVKSTELSLFEYQDADTRIKIRGTKTSAGTKSRRAPEVRYDRTCGAEEISEMRYGSADESLTGKMLESPMVGIFYAAPSEGAEPYVKVGDTVKAGQTVAIVEAMKLMNEVRAEWDGVVEEVLAENGTMVEYGQPLMRIREENTSKNIDI